MTRKVRGVQALPEKDQVTHVKSQTISQFLVYLLLWRERERGREGEGEEGRGGRERDREKIVLPKNGFLILFVHITG